MAKFTPRSMGIFLILAVVVAVAQEEHAENEYTHCDKVFVPCPRAPGFQFFNRTCYGIIRDKLPFSAGDSQFKCESGMHLTFTDPAMAPHGAPGRRSALDRRMTLARVISFGTLNLLTKLRRQVVPEPSERTLVDLACSENCSWPASWVFADSEAFPSLGFKCSDSPVCDWRRDGRSVWARPPGSQTAVAETPGQPVNLPASNTTNGTDAIVVSAPLSDRLAVLTAPGALRDAPDTISLHSLACEIPFTTTDEGIKKLIPMGLVTDADMSLHAQMVHHLAIESVNGSQTHVRLTWGPPHCEVPAFYITLLSDAEGSKENRTRLEKEDVCDEGLCQLELHLPPCSLVYIQVGSILKGQDAAPDVVQWQTPAAEDPSTPESFLISEISGSVVTLIWESASDAGPCQPYHKVTIEGHGKVTLRPGVRELKTDLGTHCWHFDASVMATILGRDSGVRGPIHGVTGPTAPETVEVLETGSSWVHLRWSHAAGPSSPCVQAKNRVTCKPVPSDTDPDSDSDSTPPRPSVSMTSPVMNLNVTGLLSGVRYRCGVCALGNLMDTAPNNTALKKPPCGDVRVVELTTKETEPGRPYGLTITSTSHDSLTLEWRRPQEANGVIIRYNISVICVPQTFPLCTSDPLCVDRWFTLDLEGNDTDHMTFTVTGLQAARLHHVTVAAATAVGQGPFSSLYMADTRPGVPTPPSHIIVTSHVKEVVGHAEQTSVSVSLRPPCPFPGPHDYRLQFERVDFLAGYQSSVRAAVLKPDEIRQLYSGLHNITFSIFDGKWTPGFNYVLRIVAHTDNNDLGKKAHAPSSPISFTMTVPPPGAVRRLSADCSSRPFRLAFSWANPTKHPFGIISYRSLYRCRHPVTGHEVASTGWHSCLHGQCPCFSSQTLSNQCIACERVCNYPEKRFNFMDAKKYYFNCTCERRVADAPVMPGSECHVSVQAESKYFKQRGVMANASCQTPPYTVRVIDLQVSCDGQKLIASWAVPVPLEVVTKAYHVKVRRSAGASGKQGVFADESLGDSQCEGTRCRTSWSELDGDVSYTVQVAAESIYSSPPVGPASESSCVSPARVPRPPSEELMKKISQLSGWRRDLDPSRQYLLRLPSDLYDAASGIFRELRVVVSQPEAHSNITSLQLPASGSIDELPKLASWQHFAANHTGSYQASPSAFVPEHDGANPAEFVVGEDISCIVDFEHPVNEKSHCNGPLAPNTSYAVQLMFVNDAGFVSTAPFTFRTKTEREARQKAAGGSVHRADWGMMGRSGLGGGVPMLEGAAPEVFMTGESVTPAGFNRSEGNSTTLEAETAGVPVAKVVGATVGSLAATGSVLAGLYVWKRRSGGNG